MLNEQDTRALWNELSAKFGYQVIDSCAVCGSTKLRAICVFRDKLCTNRCLDCGFVFLGPRLAENIYRPGHLQTSYLPRIQANGLLDADGEPVLPAIYARYRKIADLTASLNPTEAVADIGCGMGLSMLALKHLGIEATGYDLNEEFIAQARAFGLSAYQEDVVSKSVLTKKFEVVTLSSMIEHLTDPVGFLRALRKNVLAPGGHVVVTAPNILSVDFIRDGEKIANINGNHFWYFSNTTLSLALENAGFDIVKVHRQDLSVHDITMSNAQTFLEGFLGIDDNLTGGIGIIARKNDEPLRRKSHLRNPFP